MAKQTEIIRFNRPQEMPHILILTNGEQIRFNGSKHWWTVVAVQDDVAYLRKYSRWGLSYKAITLIKQDASKDLFGVTYFWNLPAEVNEYKKELYCEYSAGNTYFPSKYNVCSLEIKRKRIKNDKSKNEKAVNDNVADARDCISSRDMVVTT